ncbi:LLM class flavin-dependent oxidoreductase [Micromonospora sp. NPDC048170]|uniref:LLM class flavin-dependent oxidoreductase n=1 Tax=Micromonospora sp. NPDC048170 TaxID=3154819 RepID=UPI0033EA81E8
MEHLDIALGALVMPEHPGPRGADVWRHIEDVGFRHAWTFDHLSWRTLRDQPWFDTMTTLAAAAVRTDRIGLGTLVCTPNFRHPVLLAKSAMSIDHLSGGRLLLGLGSGAPGPDSEALGGQRLDARERAARFEEFVRLTDLLLRSPVSTHRGAFYEADDVRMVPGCLQRPRVPFAVAARGPRGMRLAAEHADVWVCNGPPDRTESNAEEAVFADLARQVDDLRIACHHRGRPFGDLRRLVYVSRSLPRVAESAARLVDVLGRCAELGFTDAVVAFPRRDGIFAGSPHHLEHVAAELATTQRS